MTHYRASGGSGHYLCVINREVEIVGFPEPEPEHNNYVTALLALYHLRYSRALPMSIGAIDVCRRAESRAFYWV